MSRPLDGDVRLKIQADYDAGMTQDKIAEKHSVSKGVVNKLVKALPPPKNVQHVTDLVRVHTALAEQRDYDVTAVTDLVKEKLDDLAFLRRCSMIVVNKAMDKVQHEKLNMFELEKAQSIIGKGRENIYGKTPDTAVQVNNNGVESVTYKWQE